MRFLLVFVCFLISSISMAGTYVAPHTKHNGTYVEGYYKSNPNHYKQDNYSAPGNTNPYTMKTQPYSNSYSAPTPSVPDYSYQPNRDIPSPNIGQQIIDGVLNVD